MKLMTLSFLVLPLVLSCAPKGAESHVRMGNDARDMELSPDDFNKLTNLAASLNGKILGSCLFEYNANPIESQLQVTKNGEIAMVPITPVRATFRQSPSLVSFEHRTRTPGGFLFSGRKFSASLDVHSAQDGSVSRVDMVGFHLNPSADNPADVSRLSCP